MWSYSQPWAVWMTCDGLDAHGLVGVLEGLAVRLVGAGLLGGDDVVELDADVLDVPRDQVVVRVGDDRNLVLGLQRTQGVRHFGEGTEGGDGLDQGVAVGLAVLQAVQAHGVAQAGVQDLVVGAVGLQNGLETHDTEVVEELVDIQVVQIEPVLDDLQGRGAELEVDQSRIRVEGDDLSHGVQPWSLAVFRGGGASDDAFAGGDDRVEHGQVGRAWYPVGRRRVGGDLLAGHGAADHGADGGQGRQCADRHLEEGQAAFGAVRDERLDLVEGRVGEPALPPGQTAAGRGLLAAPVLAAEQAVGQRVVRQQTDAVRADRRGSGRPPRRGRAGGSGPG